MARITVSPAHEPPFPVELIVLEEDRWLVLSATTRLLPERRETDELVAAMEGAAISEPGEVLFRGNRALAIVHDLDLTPTFQPAAMESALRHIIEHCDVHHIQSLAMHPLGAVHGPLSINEVRETLLGMDLGTIERIWLIDPES